MNHTPQPDLDWIDEGVAWNWEMPTKAHPLWRRWGLRHVRAAAGVLWAYLSFKPLRPDWHALWRAHWVAYAIRRGWC
jgi:hypothetical protein